MNKKLYIQLGNYALVGVLAFLSDFFVFSIMVGKLYYQIANCCGLLTGLLVNFLLSKLWVFQSKKAINKREVIAFICFTGFGFAFTGLGMFLGVEIIHWNKKLTKCIVAGIMFFFNYLTRKYVIFKHRE